MTARTTVEASAGSFYAVALGARNLVSGRDMPTDDLPGWTLEFFDDFTTDIALGDFPTVVSTKWDAYPTSYLDTSDQGRYNPAKTVSCADSKMLVRLWWEEGEDKPWVCTLRPIVITGEPLPYTHDYGRFSIRWRLKSNAGDGYKIAWLTWPVSNSNHNAEGGDGELDYPEITDFSPSNGAAVALKGYVHWQEGKLPAGSYQSLIVNQTVNAYEWHTDTIEWLPGIVKYIRDDVTLGQLTDAQLTPPYGVPNTPMSWRIQSETAIGRTTVDTDEMEIEIDWVAVWLPEA